MLGCEPPPSAPQGFPLADLRAGQDSPGQELPTSAASLSAEHAQGLSASPGDSPLLSWQPWLTEDPAALHSLSCRSQGATEALSGKEMQESFEGDAVGGAELCKCSHSKHAHKARCKNCFLVKVVMADSPWLHKNSSLGVNLCICCRSSGVFMSFSLTFLL